MSTPAFEHSIESDHHLFINLTTTKVFCLPDNYEVDSHTLKDIKFNLQPHYYREDFEQLFLLKTKYNIDGKEYIPGIIGMNNLNGTDYANATFQLFNAIRPFREFFLLQESFSDVLL
jgi:U4/U6.U5 tri-snRNP-associated protein 2